MTARQRHPRTATEAREAATKAKLIAEPLARAGETTPTHETIHQSCHDLLRVSAGLESLLLQLQADEQAANNGLHALLAPLKQQLDQAVNRVQALY
ncbi:DUF1484 family protein [Cupriavidus basilensis]|uniref:DUF1484 family protein n=1 Tax=Cupriavidus basilensis TaxID=68895 RepID=UPI0020A63A18|nr:DUF1484 family protein [Cupriavidus basilensis]MCP3020341.1 DUF1484 domain-containing protein [Cupriavidus basilensis]